MALFWTLSLIISYLHLFIQRFPFSRKSNSYPRCPPANTATFRPLCIITGATSGLGKAAAYALSKEGFYVVLVGRSSHLLSKTMVEIKEKNKNAHLKGFQVDLSSFHSILKFKGSLEQWLADSNMHSSIQLLINNAGILATSCRLTTEGCDQMMATNYMGAFSLTKLLLPLLRSSPVPSRIVNVSSFTHLNVFDMQVDEGTITGKCFSRPKQYPCAHIYEYSKLCLLLFAYELHRQLGCMHNSRHVSVIAVDPGAVETNIMREVPSCISHMAFMVLKLLFLLQSPENGVSSILDAALAPPLLGKESSASSFLHICPTASSTCVWRKNRPPAIVVYVLIVWTATVEFFHKGCYCIRSHYKAMILQNFLENLPLLLVMSLISARSMNLVPGFVN
uniref:Dehydrogenase/reductase SDR family member on chromosome X n=1 Tax=Vitis vinifera TaxID=29760 RepID=F6H2V3_VITVI